jgi:hypothetical protein
MGRGLSVISPPSELARQHGASATPENKDTLEAQTMIRRITALALSLLIVTPSAQASGSCNEFPFSNGLDFEAVTGGTRILATASASVIADDVSAIDDAREEAEMKAKARIARFLTEEIASVAEINRLVNESSRIKGDEREAVRTEMVTRASSLRNGSQALLRGVVMLGDCYTRAREVRVTVGLKPESIRAAGTAAESIGRSVAERPTATSQGNAIGQYGASPPPANAAPASGSPGGATSLRGVDGYSNTDRLKRF